LAWTENLKRGRKSLEGERMWTERKASFVKEEGMLQTLLKVSRVTE